MYDVFWVVIFIRLLVGRRDGSKYRCWKRTSHSPSTKLLPASVCPRMVIVCCDLLMKVLSCTTFAKFFAS